MPAVVIGVDAGGTRTRVACVELDGTVRSVAVGDGANRTHNVDGATSVQATLTSALVDAGITPADVVALVAGCAGLDHEQDRDWVARLTRLEGLDCPAEHRNDADVAQAGAFGGGHGIVAVSGSGSIVWGRTESRSVIRNYDFGHYARTAARFVAFDATHQLLTQPTRAADRPLSDGVLQYFGLPNLAALTQVVRQSDASAGPSRNRWYADLAPVVTRAATEGSPIARAVCDDAIRQLCTGIALVARCFRTEPVPVAPIGSVLAADYLARRLQDLVPQIAVKRCTLTVPALSPVGGAALMALRLAGAETGPAVIERLQHKTFVEGATLI